MGFSLFDSQMSSRKNEVPPNVPEIIEGLRRISNYNGIHVEDPVVKRRSSVALVLRFPGLGSLKNKQNPELSLNNANQAASGLETAPDSLDSLLNLVSTQYKSDVASDPSKFIISESPAYSPRSKPVDSAPVPPPSNKWVPEVLFIKRTSRNGDRWSGHVALPGGKRDPEDESDKATADRETLEEVGIDLNKDAYYVGPLDQRLLKTSWGQVVLMTLCPFVYVLKDDSTFESLKSSSESAFLIPQPSEIDRAFWIKVSELYYPKYAEAYEVVTLGERLRRIKSIFLPSKVISFLSKTNAFGTMLFGAIDLVHPRNMVVSIPPEDTKAPQTHPEESTMAASADPATLTSTSEEAKNSPDSQINKSHDNDNSKLSTSIQDVSAENVITVDPPYKLWGLTYGVVVDLLETFRPNSATKHLKYPTLTAPDTRFFIWLISYKYVAAERKKLKAPNGVDAGSSLDTAWEKATGNSSGKGNYYAEGQYDIVNKSLHDYFPFISKAIMLTLIFRLGVVSLVVFRVIRLLIKKKAFSLLSNFVRNSIR